MEIGNSNVDSLIITFWGYLSYGIVNLRSSSNVFDPLSPKEHEFVRRIIEMSSKTSIDLYLIENKVFRM